MRKMALVLAALIVLPVGSTFAGILTPTGLNPGDQFRIVFVTSTSSIAASSNIADYDAFVTTNAVSAGLDTHGLDSVSWQVLGSTASVSAISRVALTSPALYRVDGVRVANSGADLWDGSILNPINRNPFGIQVTGNVGVATGTNAFGAPASSGLNAFGADTVYVGQTSQTNQNWIALGGGSSSFARRFYAVSEVLTVPGGVSAVPEPSSITIWALACAGIGLKYRKRVGWKFGSKNTKCSFEA
jgi:hypothetical protein